MSLLPRRCLHTAAAIAAIALSATAGPYPAEEPETHWTWAGWGGGGWFRCAVFDPDNPDTLYMGGDVLGVYKSTDCATSWTIVNRGIQNYAVFCLAIAKSAPQTLYAMTVDGIARTTDGAAHWTPLEQTRNNNLRLSAQRSLSVQSIAVDPTDARRLYAGAGSGRLCRSDDAGETWTEIDYLSALPNNEERAKGTVATVHIAESDPRRIFVAHDKLGLFRSTDGGATWTRPKGPPHKGARHVAGGLACAPGRYFAAFVDGVWASTDGGATWSPVEAIPENGKPRMLAVDPRNPNIVHLITQNGSFITYDGGESWEPSRRYTRDFRNNPTLPHEPAGRRKSGLLANPSGIALSPADPDRIYIAANWNNVVSRDGGATWNESAKGADISCVEDLRFADGQIYAVAMDEGLLRSDDGGASWRALAPKRWQAGLSGHQWRVLPLKQPDGRMRIVSTLSPWADRGTEYPNAVLISENGHGMFEILHAGLPPNIPRENTMWEQGYARALAVDPANPNVMYLGIDGDPTADSEGGGIFRSENGGRFWQRLPSQPASRRMYFGLAVDPTDSKRLYWGACGKNAGVYVSPDAGETWQKTPVSEWIYNVETAPSGLVLAGGKNLWLSRDHGETWSAVTKLNGITVVGIAVDPENEQRMWISAVVWGTASGGAIYESRDGGASWTDITGDIPYNRPLVLRYHPQTHELWAAGVGIFKTNR